ncbi:MAG: hypothetical protein NUV51_03945 [Sulfuricaulis sp.]|nr:hypothetical protein [Sulfuricaulis sp.]
MRLLPPLLLLSGCVAWYPAADVPSVQIARLETTLAAEFCEGLLGEPRAACAIRLKNTDTARWRCVVVIQPGDGNAAAHEGGHCLGFDH